MTQCHNRIVIYGHYFFQFLKKSQPVEASLIFLKINPEFAWAASKQLPKRAYSLYLWPRSKVWIRAYKASIQTAATKVSGLGAKFGCECCKRTFKPPRLKSQICFIYLQEFVCSAASQIRIFNQITELL